MIKFIPNALTIFRILLTPVFLILAIFIHTQTALYWAWIIFVVAAITDWLDGLIARKHNIITNFGKIWDPLADKIIVLAALAALTWSAPFKLHWIIFAVIAIREMAVTIMREVYIRKQIVVAASKWGKLKTVLQMVGILLCLGFWAIGYTPEHIILGSKVWFWIVALVTVLSGLNYIYIDRTKS